MSSVDLVRIGVVGGGAMAQLVHLPLLSDRADVDVVAFADPDEVKRRALGERFGIPKLVDDDALFGDPEIDVVLVHTPNHLHAGLTRRALEAGKHVFTESPLAMSSQEARELVDLADERELNLCVGFGHRFRPDVSALRAFVQYQAAFDSAVSCTGALRSRPTTLAVRRAMMPST